MPNPRSETSRQSLDRLNPNQVAEGLTSKENYDVWSKSNRHGSISFGSIHQKGDVTSGVKLETSDSNHVLCFDSDGERKGWTTLKQPGQLSIDCGMEFASTTSVDDPKEKGARDSLCMHAHNGNITINARNGKLRLEADDIELVARGDGSTQGIIKLTSTQKIRLHSKNIEMHSGGVFKIVSTDKLEITANTCMKIYSSIIAGISDAVNKKDSKNGHKRFQQKQSQAIP